MTGKRFASASRSTTERRDLHAELTQKIIAKIEAGAGEFKMPWHRPGLAFSIPKNALTHDRYRGGNILWLWMEADAKKLEHQVWATYRQWHELGAQVRGGEKGALIVKYGEWVPKSERKNSAPAENDNDDDAGKRLFAKPAHVFNIDQVEVPPELRASLLPPQIPRPDLTNRLAQVDDFIAATGAEFREGGQRAFYRHKSPDGDGDFIQMPPRNLFVGTDTSTPTEAYESTRLHELTHWSGAEHRLQRQRGARFGDNAYAVEELVAELASAYLSAELEVTNVPRLDHAQYIANWLTVLKADSKAIFSAAAAASRAVGYLMEPQPNFKPEPDAPATALNRSSNNHPFTV